MNAKDIEKRLEDEGFTMTKGDVDLTYGQTWVREDEWGGFDILEIVDVDSAAGADGQIVVETMELHFDYVSAQDHKSVQSYADTRSYLPDLARKDRDLARLAYAADLADAGCGDQGYWCSAIVDRWAFNRGSRRAQYGRRVSGWGYAAILRAIENCLDAFVGGFLSPPHETTDRELGDPRY